MRAHKLVERKGTTENQKLNAHFFSLKYSCVPVLMVRAYVRLCRPAILYCTGRNLLAPQRIQR